MTTDTNQSSNRPSHRLYQVTGEAKSAIWTPIASAWANKDGKGFTILVPFLGRVIMREITDKSGEDQERLS